VTDQTRSALWSVRYPVLESSAEAALIIIPPPPHPMLLPVSIQNQEQSNWCWDAIGSGIASFYDRVTYSQCATATNVAKALWGWTADCCDRANASLCNYESGPDQALDHSDNTKRHSNGNIEAPVDMARIIGEIDQSRPVGAEITWEDGSGKHEVAITGYTFAGDPAIGLIYIQDPQLGPSWSQVPAFTTRYHGNGAWTKTFWTQPA
jgi:Papain-like cysteine protease AvrRpt2